MLKYRRKLLTGAAAAAAAATIAVTGITAASAAPHSGPAHNASHTLKFTTVVVKRVAFTRTNFGLQETDVNSAGKTIGFDNVNIRSTSRTSARADVAVDVKGGFLYGTVTTTNGGKTFSGKVTGGTGTFKGATGTITGKSIASNKTAVTIIYS
jgi:hypothetical protein